MRHLSLAEVLNVHRQQGHRELSVVPRGGEFDISMYRVADPDAARMDPDAWRSGKRDFREVKHNLVTKFLSEWAVHHNYQISASSYVFISSEPFNPHFLKMCYRSTFSGGYASASSFIIDTVARLWTVTGTILAPAAGKTRTFQSVGFSHPARGAFNVAENQNFVVAATKLSSPRVQDETQQIVVSYRLAWEEGSDV